MLPDDMDAVFLALGNRDRRLMLDLIGNNTGCCVEDLCRHFEFSRIAVLKHLRVLARAQLVHSEKVGRKRKLYFNVVPIQLIYDRWATDYSALWAGKLADIKYQVETEAQRTQRKRHA